jgi:hypothetical protein
MTLVLVSTAACSPGMFFGGGGADPQIIDQKSYRQVNLACSGLDLSSSQIDVPTFKRLLGCFNSNGSLQPLADMVAQTSDDDLQAILDIGNKYFLNDDRLIFELEQTYYALLNKGILDVSLAQFGKLLQNSKFVASGLALLRAEFSGDDTALLKALELYATQITSDNTKLLLDLGVSIAGSRAFPELESRFRGDSPRGLKLFDISSALLDYMKGVNQLPPRRCQKSLGLQALESVVNNDLYLVLDAPNVIGADPTLYPVTIPRFASFLYVTGANGARIFDGLSMLFTSLNGPVSCLGGGAVVPNADLNLLQELIRVDSPKVSEFVRETIKLDFVPLNSACQLPPQTQVYYPAMISLASTRAMEPTADVLKGLYTVGRIEPNLDTCAPEPSLPLVDLLITFLTDRGTDLKSGTTLLLPLLSELTDRGVWEDLLLVASLPTPEARAKLQSMLQFLVTAVPGVGASTYDVFANAIAKTSPLDFYNFVSSMETFVDSPTPLLVPSLTALRSAFYANDVHPLIDIIHNVLASASANPRFFEALSRISAKPQFQGVVGMVSDMSRADDGRLKDLLGAVVTLFHKFGQRGKVPVNDTTEPPLAPLTRHDLVASNLVAFPLLDTLANPALAACDAVDFSIPTGDPRYAGWGVQVGNLLACVNSDGAHQDVVDSINFLQNAPTADKSESILALGVQLLENLGLSHDEYAWFTNKFTSSIDDGTVNRAAGAVPFWVPVVQPLIQLARPLTATDALLQSMHRIESFAADVVSRADFPKLLNYASDLFSRDPEPVSAPTIRQPDYDELARWIEAKECEHVPKADPSGYLRARAAEVFSEYRNEVTVWDLDPSGVKSPVVGWVRPREGWGKQELHDALEPVLQKLSEGVVGDAAHSVQQALLNVIGYFSGGVDEHVGPVHHYPPSYLRDWVKNRSDDWVPVTYFYPGDREPRVRLVSTLDRFELVLINSDVVAPVLNSNFGLEYLADMGEAWGDEPYEAWPAEIKAKFPIGGKKAPITIAEAVAKIITAQKTFEDLVGMPDIPKCASVEGVPSTYFKHGVLPEGKADLQLKAGLYNSRQVLSVLTENLPNGYYIDSKGNPIVDANGKLIHSPNSGGLKVLRDMFFQLYYSTPTKYMNPKAGWNNNLSVIIKLVRDGFTHQIGRAVRNFDDGDPTLLDFFSSFVLAGTAKATPELVNTVLGDPKHALVWAVMDEIYDVLAGQDLQPFTQSQALAFDGYVTRLNALADTDPNVEPTVNALVQVCNAATGNLLDSVHLKDAHDALRALKGKPASEFHAAVDGLRKTWAQDVQNMEQLAHYTISMLGPVGSLPTGNAYDVLEPAIDSIAQAIGANRDFLIAHADKVETLLRSSSAATGIRALYEDQDGEKKTLATILMDAFEKTADQHYLLVDGVDLLAAVVSDPATSGSWDTFNSRWDALDQNSAYQGLNLSSLTAGFKAFIKETSGDANETATADQLRSYLAARLRAGDIDQFIQLAGSKPDQFYQLLETVSHYVQSKPDGSHGGLIQFLELLRRSLAQPSRAE